MSAVEFSRDGVRAFRFVRCDFDPATGVAELAYAFDDGPELVETVTLPGAPFDLDGARAQAAQQALRLLRSVFTGGVLVIPSSPPTLGIVGWWLSWIGRKYVYVLHDVHPNLGIALGRMKPGFMAGVLRRMQRRILKRGRTITLTEGMKANALTLQPKARVDVVPNWVDTDSITPIGKTDSEFAKANDLVQPFVVQYSGNLGLLHPLDGLTRAFAELPDAVLTYIGRGAKLDPTRKLAQDLPNVRFFDYQPFNNLNDSLAACDLAVVAIEPAADGLAMPSKLQGILASGRAVLALAPEGSELAEFVNQHDCGVVVSDFTTPPAVAAAIRALKDDPGRRQVLAGNARAAAEKFFHTGLAAERYLNLIKGL